jgi:hypothetical protein
MAQRLQATLKQLRLLRRHARIAIAWDSTRLLLSAGSDTVLVH